MHGNYQEAARGNVSNSDLSWAIYEQRGWNEPNLISYPESHDEERIMYVIKQTGLTDGNYNIKNQTTALKRIELNSVFNIPLPGPKMIWQFGERGYDQSINRCVDGTVSNNCRLSPKPSYWQYLFNPDRIALFEVMAKLNELKQTYDEFTPESFSYDLTSAIKWYLLTNGSNHVFSVGNFDVVQKSANVKFPKTGKWYEFFTGDSIDISTTNQSIPLAPGEYRLYSTRKFDDPHVITENKDILQQAESIKIYPNPAQGEINITSSENFTEVQIYSVTGKQILRQKTGLVNQLKLNIEGFSPGIYLLKIVETNRVSTLKFVRE
ncbi:MAG TPA: T9SS type A sorting domain-containing protein, partial [Draconibacterium sp.]|nr:T9SS type A sorting domain-containing protein [Draconibacterium sp.]